MGLLLRLGVVWILAGAIMAMTGCFKVCMSTERLDSVETVQHMTDKPLMSIFSRGENDKAR